jgi:hypothetical protein
MDYQKLVQKTVDLRNEGRLEDSRNLVMDYLREEPQNIEALYLLTDLLEDPKDKINVLDQILSINPNNRDAHEKIKQIQLDTALNNAYELAKNGKIDETLSIVDRVITEDMRKPAAWYLKASYSNDPKDVNVAMAELEKLSATNEDAKLYLEQLRSKKAKPKEKIRRIRTGYLFILAAFVILVGGICGLIFYPLLIGDEEPTQTSGGLIEQVDTLAVEVVQTQTLLSCQEIIEKAILLAEDVCSGLDSNQACYGNQTVFADFVPDFTGRFEMVGDLVGVDKLTRIVASPLQYEEQLWGIAFLKLQANLPGTLPGQNVTFLVFGDTVLENNSQNMSTFYFTTGLTGISCERVDYDGLLVENPDGYKIEFRSNGVDVILEGEAILQAQPAGEMSVAMLSGSSELSSNGQTVSLNAGSYSTIPMSENLEPGGPISEPKPLSEELLGIACQLIGIGCPGNPIPTVTLTNTPTPTVQIVMNTPVPPPPTSTSPPPPTNTPAPGTCSDIHIAYAAIGGTPQNPTVQYQITNNFNSDIVITKIDLAWPVAENGTWEKTDLNNVAIHSKKMEVSPATAVLFADFVKRTITIGNSGLLEFQFENLPASSGYQVNIEFDVGCTKTRSH